MTRRSRFLRIAGLAVAALAAVVTVIAMVGVPITPYVEGRLHRYAREHMGSDLEFSNISVTLLPLTARVDDLVFRHKGRRDVPPLVQIRRATAYVSIGSLFSFLGAVPSIRYLQLDGLTIHVARRKAPGDDQKKESDAGDDSTPSFVIEELAADGTVLRILPKDEWKDPMEYRLKSLRMNSVGPDEPMHFVSELTNATPPGLIHTEGYFGPWGKEDPGLTPVEGDYTFDNADLGHFNGIGGTLSSKGTFDGELARLVVDGHTDTPDFSVDVSGRPVHLETRFHAIVDGTNGDTLLQPVVARFGNSTVTVNGGVYGIKGVKGKTVKLDVDVDDARIEDMMRFAVEKPIIQGPIRYQAKMEIPPGDERVVRKLRLDGQFRVAEGHFADAGVREKLGNLSNKARGEPKAPPPADTASDFGGHFNLRNALLTLHGLSFHVPGARVRLDGTYHLIREDLDFKGKLEMDAKVSETTTGVKSWFLKIADLFFKGKNGAGSEIPIKIEGKRDDPQFGLDVGEALSP